MEDQTVHTQSMIHVTGHSTIETIFKNFIVFILPVSYFVCVSTFLQITVTPNRIIAGNGRSERVSAVSLRCFSHLQLDFPAL